jgi:uncharacterized protein (DUF58 family)
MITGRGLAWLMLILLLYLGLAYSGIRQLAVILMIALLLPLISLIFLHLARRRIALRLSIDQPVLRRLEETALKIRLTYPGWQVIGLADLRIEKPAFKARGRRERRYLTIRPHRDLLLTVRLESPHRGFQPINVLLFRARDLFGLFRLPVLSRKARLRLSQTLTVLPRAYPFDPLTALAAALLKQQQQQAWQVGSELDAIANIRQQQPGDSIKRAHWKLSARQGELMIREFENPLQQEALILIDLSGAAVDATGLADFADYFTDCAAWLVEVILKASCRVRLVAYQDQGRIEAEADRSGQEQSVLLVLAGISPDDQWQPDQVVLEESARQRDARLIALVSDRISPATADRLLGLPDLGRDVWLVLIEPLVSDDPAVRASVNRLEQGGVTVCRTSPVQSAVPAPKAADSSGAAAS